MKEHGICAKCKKSVGCPYADDRIKGCKKFILEYELKLTNEELFCQLSTEEKAKALQLIYINGADDMFFDRQQKMVKDFISWLKETHND